MGGSGTHKLFYIPIIGAFLLANGPIAQATDSVDNTIYEHFKQRSPLQVGAELRGGVQTSPTQPSPVLCGQLNVNKRLSFESCGDGLGLNDSQMGTAHFRMEANIPLAFPGRYQINLQPGLGFIEVENGDDEPGFLFGAPRSKNQKEAAGPSGSMGAHITKKISKNLYLVTELNTTVSWVSAAPQVIDSDSPLLITAMTSVGIGF